MNGAEAENGPLSLKAFNQDRQDYAAKYCPQYDRGFCIKGIAGDSRCKHWRYHIAATASREKKKSNICRDYMAGFCPYGPYCEHIHLKAVIIDEMTTLKQLANFPDSENWPKNRSFRIHDKVVCHNCGERGHKSTYCQKDKVDVIIERNENGRVRCFGCG